MKKTSRLLIIDDSNEILASLTNFFSKRKYDVISAATGLEGLKHIETQGSTFDLVITDLVLPNISGVAIISIVKNKFPKTPVIAITGWGEHPEALAKEARADYVLEKPFKLPLLEQLVKKILK